MSGLFRVLAAALTLVIAASGAEAAATPAAPAAALSARVGDDVDGGEVVTLEMSERLGFRVFSLADPPRIVVDFPMLDWRFQPPRPGPGQALLAGFRLGLTQGGAARMVIDLRAPARVRRAYTETTAEGGRFVLRLAPMAAEDFAAGAGWPADLAPRAPTPRPERAGPPTPRPRPHRGVRVAIDAGHGGRDSGASHGALLEKNLALDYARALAARIDAETGFSSYLVRDSDIFLRLRRRVARARRAKADVFISLHADALASGSARGVSVYTLSAEASDEEARELALSANRADVIDGVTLDDVESDVTSVLVDLARRRTGPESTALAGDLIAALDGRAPILRGRALQSADFRVLKAPDMPSVLVEIGFLSADHDRARLMSEQGRDELVDALARGVFRWADMRRKRRHEAQAAPPTGRGG